MTIADPVRVEPIHGGACWMVVLGGSKGNILDAASMDALRRVFDRAAGDPHLKAICLTGDGAHFSYGASVPEHLPDRVEGMLRRFHDLVGTMIACSVATLAAVRGQCLGGALELVTCCHRVFASPDARLGQPEIVLGVFAPVASVVLPERIGRGRAEDLCLTGRTVDATDALGMGLVDEVVDDPVAAASAYIETHLLPKSASSLRLAVKALRGGLRARLERELPSVERVYLDELMRTGDAVEGLQAFVERRRPLWRDR
ncbi:MAG: enoyl-CoA hydratase-related protein [Vicinamibacterales bacterium]